MKSLKQVIIHHKISFVISIFILSHPFLHIVDATDLDRDTDILLTDIDEQSEGRFLNLTLNSLTVFLLGALATVLLVSIPIILALLMGSKGGGDDTGYGSSSNAGYGGDHSYYYSSRKRRSPDIDVKINSK